MWNGALLVPGSGTTPVEGTAEADADEDSLRNGASDTDGKGTTPVDAIPETD